MIRHDAEPEDAPVLAVKTPDLGGEDICAIRVRKDVTASIGAGGQERNRAWLGVNGLIETSLFSTRF